MKFIQLFIFLLLFFSCTENTIFEKKVAVNKNGWHSNDKVLFSVNILDTISSYTVFLEIENTEEYKWENLFLFTDITFPDGKHIKDTADFLLSYSNGKWIGEQNGEIYTSKYPYKHNIRFPLTGTYSFSFEQAMRCGKTKTLTGIESLSLTIHKQ